MVGGHRVALIVPTLDEAEAIGPALARVPREVVDRVIVADGGSQDGTAEHARVAGAMVIAAGRGYGRACLAGALMAEDCPILCFMDGDGADRPEATVDLVGPIAAGSHDLVIGSRTRGVREAGSMGLHQIAAGYLIGGLVGMRHGVIFTDMCAFRAIRRDALMALGLREMSFGWNLEMQIRAARAGLRIREVPVPYGVRIAGRSKVAGSLRGTLQAGASIAATLWRADRAPIHAPEA